MDQIHCGEKRYLMERRWKTERGPWVMGTAVREFAAPIPALGLSSYSKAQAQRSALVQTTKKRRSYYPPLYQLPSLFLSYDAYIAFFISCRFPCIHSLSSVLHFSCPLSHCLALPNEPLSDKRFECEFGRQG
jgi:hypothetical protein